MPSPSTTIEHRKELFSSVLSPNPESKNKQAPSITKKNAAEEAKRITSSLLRTKKLMRQELERVSEVSKVIKDDEKILKETKTEHLGLGGITKGAKGALGKLKRQDMRDVVVLWLSLSFYGIVAVYVLWSRIRIPFLLW